MMLEIPLQTPSYPFNRPLDAIQSEHDRQLLIYQQIVEEKDARLVDVVIEHADALLTYFSGTLPQHASDEETDLFPLLALRCEPEDEIDKILEQLEFEHSIDQVLVSRVIASLRALVRKRDKVNEQRLVIDLRLVAEVQRRHVAWENAVALPLAHKRLTRNDLAEMGRNVAERRGHPYVG